MKAQELRIGNYVNLIIPEIGKVEWKTIPADILGCYQRPDLFEPIPLTEDWLMRFGFVNHPRLPNIYHKTDITLKKRQDNRFMLIDVAILVEVKYVHQLQNLYYCLVGEELTLNTRP